MRLTAFSDVSLRVLMLLSALEPGVSGFDARSLRRCNALGIRAFGDGGHHSSCY